MTLFRLVLCLLCLAAGGVRLEQERRAGRLQLVDEVFLDLLTANARDRLTRVDPQAPDQVVLVTLRETDRGEFADWPPPPLDWQTLLKALAAHTPEVVILTEPLQWGEPKPDFVPAVAEALLAFPSVVLGLPTGEAGSKENADALHLPAYGRVRGDPPEVPTAGTPSVLPVPEVRGLAELGLLATEGEGLPYVLRQGDDLVPGLLAQALARRTRTPFTSQSLRLGPGAGAHLNQGVHVPLTPDGRFLPDSDRPVPTVNALQLMTGALADTLSDSEREALGSGRIAVVGIEAADGSSTARRYAQALQHILSLPRLRQLRQVEEWGVAGLAGLIAMWTAVRTRRHRALRVGLGWMFAALVACFLAFQTALIWCPPTLPVFALACGALIARLFGARADVAAAAAEGSVGSEPPASAPADTPPPADGGGKTTEDP